MQRPLEGICFAPGCGAAVEYKRGRRLCDSCRAQRATCSCGGIKSPHALSCMDCGGRKRRKKSVNGRETPRTDDTEASPWEIAHLVDKLRSRRAFDEQMGTRFGDVEFLNLCETLMRDPRAFHGPVRVSGPDEWNQCRRAESIRRLVRVGAAIDPSFDEHGHRVVSLVQKSMARTRPEGGG